ncbi:hypothetical protein RWE15_15355 [Virgibacillus halophilus]|uniref:Uncharacterized protein n=1 Tax=Tigheibacillus halophilus TaxID=361280 RepID=A0ABU5C891_9BACI|nr:hypothetical protein [Virgibacillus halophilus]
MLQKGIGFREHKQQNGFFGKLKEAFYFSTIQRQEFSKKFDGVSVRFMVVPKWNGLMKILSGMTVANRPWAIMPSFKGVTGVAFATGAYMLIFTTLWQLSALYGLDRFVGLMLAAMFGMVSWIIFAHDLWEKAGGNNSKRLRLLYNATTVLTLSTSVIVFYVSLFYAVFDCRFRFCSTGHLSRDHRPSGRVI